MCVNLKVSFEPAECPQTVDDKHKTQETIITSPASRPSATKPMTKFYPDKKAFLRVNARQTQYKVIH